MGNPAWWALGVAVVSLITSGLTLLWNIMQFRRSGRVLDIKSAWHVNFPEGGTGASDFESSFVVRTTNTGRSAITIDMIMAGTLPRSALGATNAGLQDGDSLPYRLEPGSTRIWRFSLPQLLAELGQEQQATESVIGFANIGDGTTVETAPAPIKYLDQTLGRAIRGRAALPNRITGISSDQF